MKQLTILILAVFMMQACSNSPNKKTEEKSTSKLTLTAAGATFPMPY